jgi:hypothetical protein
VFDILLPASAVRFVAGAEADARPERARALLQTWRGPGWEQLPRNVAPWAFLAVVLVLLLPWRLNKIAHACGRCGRMCCPHCFTTDDEPSALCAACIVADPTRPKRARTLRRRTADDAPAWAAAYIASMFPGAADLLRGRPLMALPAVLLASIALLGLQGAVDAMRADPLNWMVLGSNTVRLALIAFYAAYLPGLLHLRRAMDHRPSFRGSGA